LASSRAFFIAYCSQCKPCYLPTYLFERSDLRVNCCSTTIYPPPGAGVPPRPKEVRHS
jgi:ribosomal protein S27E